MADCDDVLRELYEFLDDELTSDNRARIRHHLEACAHCFEAFDFEAELRIVIAQKCRDQAPAGLMDRIRLAIIEESQRSTPA